MQNGGRRTEGGGNTRNGRARRRTVGGRRRAGDEEAEVRELQAFIARGMAEAAALGVPPEEFMRRVVARSPGVMKILGPHLERGP